MQGKDMTLSADFFDRPDQFVQWINWEEEIAYIVEMSRSEYEQSAFLDYRIFEQFDKGALRLPVQDLRKLYAANVKPVSKRCYIFHTTFCGSTLLARSLNNPGTCLAYKEPLALHDFSFVARDKSRAPEGLDLHQALELVLATLDRTYSSGEVPLIKPSDSANILMQEVLSRGQQTSAVLLYSSFDSFAVSALQHKIRREFVRSHINRSRRDLELLGFPHVAKDEYTDAEAVGLFWYAMMALHNHILSKDSFRVCSLNSASMYEDPETVLTKVSQFFGLTYPEGYFEREVREGAFTRDSKDDSAVYDPEAAKIRNAQRRAKWADEIADARGFLERLCAARDVPEVLPRSVLA